jgi:hypothetical protein
MTSSGAYDATATLMLAALVAAGDAKRPRDVAPADIRDGLAKINNKGGQKVRPIVDDFSSAIRLIAKGKPINYEGAYDSDDWDAAGDMFPPLVHWKVENHVSAAGALEGGKPAVRGIRALPLQSAATALSGQIATFIAKSSANDVNRI